MSPKAKETSSKKSSRSIEMCVCGVKGTIEEDSPVRNF